jgi:hypothetical protein
VRQRERERGQTETEKTDIQAIKLGDKQTERKFNLAPEFAAK